MNAKWPLWPYLVFFFLMYWTPFGIQARGPMPGVNSDTRFVVYYGDAFYTNTSGAAQTWVLNDALIADMSRFDVVVLQPNQPHMTPEVVDELKRRGVTYVLGYISVGEDFINDAIESPLPGSGMLEYNLIANDLVPAATSNLQSFYMDVDSQTVSYDTQGRVIAVHTTARKTPDGKPDLNPIFLGYMVNPDTNWRWVIDNMRIGAQDVYGRSYKAGLKQLAGARDVSDLRNRSTDFGFDGFFLDTLDTAGPYDGEGWYPWTIDEMRDTVKYISDQYSDKVIMANRGAFFFTPGLKSPVTEQYSIDFSIRPYVNAFLFESFRYDSDSSTDASGGITEFYNENRYNIAPKVFAEASRADGFSMFSLEYESGRSGIVNDAFNTDIRALGFSAYLTSHRDLNTLDFDFYDRLPDSANDNQAPTWDNTGHVLYNTPATEVRVGVQSLHLDAANNLLVNWDIAMDQSLPVSYDLVVTNLTSNEETRIENVSPQTPNAWLTRPDLHPAYQYSLSGLEENHSYTIRVVAKDSLGNVNTQDTGKQVFLSGAVSNPIVRADIQLDGSLSEWSGWMGFAADPDDMAGTSPAGHVSGEGNQANWRQIQLAHTTDTQELFMAYTNQTNIYVSWGFQVFVDADDDAATGFQGSFGGIASFPIGADYLIEGVNVYQYDGDGNNWRWVVSPNSGGFEVGRIWSGNTGEVFLPLHWIGNPVGSFSFICFGNNQFYGHPGEYDWYPDNAASGGFFRYQL